MRIKNWFGWRGKGGGGSIWPANLTSAAFRQANKQNSLTTSCTGCVFTESTEIKQHTQEEKKTLGEGGGIRDKLRQESSFEADSPGCCDALEASKSRKSTFLHEDKWGVNYWLFFCCTSPVESCSLPIFWINVFKICLFEAPCWLKTDVVTDAHTSAHN